MELFPTINSLYVLWGSLILGALAGMLGVFAVLRKQGLIADALSHSALPGIAFAFLLMKTKFLPGLLFGALVSAFLAAFLIYFLVSKTKAKMDSSMAAVLSAFFGLGVLLLTYIQKLPIASQSGLESFIFGQAASLLKFDVYMMLGALVVVLFVVVVFWKELKLFIFDPQYAKVLGFKRYVLEFILTAVLAIAILMSLQSVGVVLTAALFITPAVAALMWSHRLLNVVLLSTLFGMLAGAGGAIVSTNFASMPTGPVIVVIISMIFFISFFCAPKKGFISKWLSYRANSLKVQKENVLSRLYRDYERGVMNLNRRDYLNYGYKPAILLKLKALGLVTILNDEISFTKVGLNEAAKIVEKHRLWETYLVSKMHLPPDHVHRDAEQMEHILTDEMVGKLRKILKNPKVDPHGKPIKR